jgi:hypothetical protein
MFFDVKGVLPIKVNPAKPAKLVRRKLRRDIFFILV